MKRFQEALSKMLKDHISKVSVELREKVLSIHCLRNLQAEELKREKKNHLDLGSTLYSAQQELAGSVVLYFAQNQFLSFIDFKVNFRRNMKRTKSAKHDAKKWTTS